MIEIGREGTRTEKGNEDGKEGGKTKIEEKEKERRTASVTTVGRWDI